MPISRIPNETLTNLALARTQLNYRIVIAQGKLYPTDAETMTDGLPNLTNLSKDLSLKLYLWSSYRFTDEFNTSNPDEINVIISLRDTYGRKTD